MARKPLSRRTFLRGAGATLGALGGAVATGSLLQTPAHIRAADDRPNILIVMVDQLRYPQWFPDQATLDAALPTLAALRNSSVAFGQYYTASSACSPARGCLLTGLYAHQTYCLKTLFWPRTPDLHPAFPTYGSMLRQLGYGTFWFGKWHVSRSCDLEPYGFSGGTCPSPDGSPGQGLASDPGILDQALGWLRDAPAAPWCTTVSLVNPHDITWYPNQTNRVLGENAPPPVFSDMPLNFETPDDHAVRRKPRLQQGLERLSRIYGGYIPFSGPNFRRPWLRMLDLYLLLQQYIDRQIARLVEALEARPSLAENTIVIFTSDHGEHAGSHGLRNKGGGAYDESIRVPLYVRDPSGRFTSALDTERSQLVSSVDVAPLLLTLASGDNGWRERPEYSHLANRLDIAAILRDPQAPGRPYVLHTTDEDVVEELPFGPEITTAPYHVVALRSAQAKLGIYSHWAPDSADVLAPGAEYEYYDYASEAGRQELDNAAYRELPAFSALLGELREQVVPQELRQPLPEALRTAQQEALNAYLKRPAHRLFLPVLADR